MSPSRITSYNVCYTKLLRINGDPEPEPPRYAASFINDYLTATFLFGGVCAAYINVQNGGMGQEVDMAQVEAFARVLDDQWT